MRSALSALWIAMALVVSVSASGAATTCVPVTVAAGDYPVLLVKARVNGQGPYTFFVDTGATVSIVSSTLAAKLGLREVPVPVKGLGAGGQFSAHASFGSIAVGNARQDHVMLGIFDFGQIQKAVGSADGFLGYNFLRAYRVTIDYPNRWLCLDPSRASALREPQPFESLSPSRASG